MKPSFIKMTAMGRSVVFCQTVASLNTVEQLLLRKGSVPVVQNNFEGGLAGCLEYWENNRVYENYGVLLLHALLSNGWHTRCDRVIFVSDSLNSHDVHVRALCAARGNTAYGHPADWLYNIAEIAKELQ